MAQMLTGTLQPQHKLDEEQPITAKQCAAMMQEALQQRVAPAMGASFGALAGVSHQPIPGWTCWRQKLAERDILSSQIEQAKRTIVRQLTVKHALTEAGLHIEGGPQLGEFTIQKLVGDDGKQFLSAVSFLTGY